MQGPGSVVSPAASVAAGQFREPCCDGGGERRERRPCEGGGWGRPEVGRGREGGLEGEATEARQRSQGMTQGDSRRGPRAATDQPRRPLERTTEREVWGHSDRLRRHYQHHDSWGHHSSMVLLRTAQRIIAGLAGPVSWQAWDGMNTGGRSGNAHWHDSLDGTTPDSRDGRRNLQYLGSSVTPVETRSQQAPRW